MSTVIDWANALKASMDNAAVVLTDAQAAKSPLLYPAWKVGEVVKVGDRRYYEPTKRLYKVRQAHTTQADWTPDITPALWTVIDVEHAGTVTDPIPASRGMEYTYGLYYIDPEESKIYLCQRGSETGTIALQYLPHELIGHYFVEVTE